nr:hypothetical protein BaRGS_007138 [Batillaria attramentaria]
MSDNWRDKGAAAGEEEDDGDWRKAGRDRWSTRTNWRGPGRGGLDAEPRNGAFSRGRGFDTDERGRRVGEPWESEDVPEWAEDGADDVGTFDSSGAFVSNKLQGRGFPADGGAVEEQSAEDNDTSPRSQQQREAPWRRRTQVEEDSDLQSQPPPQTREKLSNGTSGPHPGNREAPPASSLPNTSAPPPSMSVAGVVPPQPAQSGPPPDVASVDAASAMQQTELMAESLAAEAVGETQEPVNGGQASDDENALKWFYTDPQGEVQGPFTADEMSQWFSAGYFTMNLLVKRGCDQQFNPLGELIKKWGRVPFLPGPAPPPVLPNTPAAVEVVPISSQPALSIQQPTPTSVPAPIPAPIPAPSFPAVPVSAAADPILMQQQLLIQQQILQQQLVIRQLQMQTLAQLQEQESFKALDPIQQQQVSMQMMQANPLLLQQMQTLQHLQQIQQQTQQQASQGQAQSAVPPQQLAPSQSSGVEAGLSASPPNFHRSLSQPVPATDNQSDTPSIWGSTPPPTGAWSQPNSVWDLDNGSAPMPPAMKSELDKIRLEKEVELARLAEEERKRQEEILQKQEELRRQQEALQREREQMQREKEELERQRQLELQRLEEVRRQQEEEQRRREQEEAERLRQMKEEVERKRQAEQQRRKEEERRRQEEERRKQEEQRKQEEEEEERRRQEEMRRKREAEEQAMLELQRQEELRQQQEAERQRREAERQQQELETQRKQDLQRQQQEALRRLQQQQQMANMQLPSTANWARQQQQQQQQVGGASRSLAEIQQEEELQHQQQMELQRQQMLQAQAEQMAQQQQQQKSWASNFAAQQPARPKTLAEIQEEEERELRQEKQKRQQQQQYQAKNMSLSSAAVWGSGSTASSTFSSNSSAWGGGSVWGSENSVSLWGDAAYAQSSSGAAQGSKGKKSAKESAPSAEFPALKTTKASNKSQAASGKAAAPAKPKKEEEAVQRLFQKTAQQKDEFTVWCEAFLEGMEVTVDIETFVSFLQAVDSPYEVHDYVRNYLGEGKDAREFAKQFMDKRNHYKNKARTEKRMEEESIWGPAPALNPREVRGVPQQINSDHSHGHGDGGKSKGGKKKKKMQKLDGSALLGFTVEKDPNRKNAGEIESFP